MKKSSIKSRNFKKLGKLSNYRQKNRTTKNVEKLTDRQTGILFPKTFQKNPPATKTYNQSKSEIFLLCESASFDWLFQLVSVSDRRVKLTKICSSENYRRKQTKNGNRR